MELLPDEGGRLHATASKSSSLKRTDHPTAEQGPESKRRMVQDPVLSSPTGGRAADGEWTRSALAPPRRLHPRLQGCRSVYAYERINEINEGTYGVVFRARCKETQRIYALKKLKLSEETGGFPITAIREIATLMRARNNENICRIEEILVGDNVDQVFICLELVAHDLKNLLETMPQGFSVSEVKTLTSQLLGAVAHCHGNWILHRDLKTSNLLLSNRGELKVADFGLARTFGDPLGEMTQLVVTLWYRSPELLLGAKEYSTAVDMWSVGCIFVELMQRTALFQGRGEIDQIGQIFRLLGRPSQRNWPGYNTLPLTKTINKTGPEHSILATRVPYLTASGLDLLEALLAYDPTRRISAEGALRHGYFREAPLPKHPDLFSSFPSHAAGERRHRASPAAPHKPHFAAAEEL